MPLLQQLRTRFRRPRDPGQSWPHGTAWMAGARPCDACRLDAGYAVTAYVPPWLLPHDAPDDQPIALPNLPLTAGHVLTSDAAGREPELIRHFAQLPPLPAPARQREIVPFSSLGVDLLLCPPDTHPILADTFAPSRHAADALLALLEDHATSPGTIYDNLDQGWAVQIMMQPDAVYVLAWNWEDAHGMQHARALRLPRSAIAAQARAARHRLRHLHATLTAALGRDLWAPPTRL